MLQEDKGYFRIEVQTSSPLFSVLEKPSLESCIEHFDIVVKHVPNNDLEFSEEVVGGASMKLVKSDRAENNGIDLFDLYDSDSELFPFYESAFDLNTRGFKKCFAGAAKDDSWVGMSADILYLERVGVIAEYQHRGIGRALIRNILERYSSTAVFVVVTPVPFELNRECITESGILWPETPDEYDSSDLKKFYGSLGFVPILSTKYMLYNLEVRR